MKKALLFLFIFSATMASASVVTIGGMKYDIQGTKAAVISRYGYYGDYLNYNFNYTGTSYTIPSSITYNGNTYTVDRVAYNAFTGYYADHRDCVQITSITLPNTITTIGQFAFEGTGLSKMIIPKSVVTFEGDGNGSYAPYNNNAFRDCSFLTTLIYLPTNAPRNWTATTYTYVPDKYSYSKPQSSINDAHVIEMISFAENAFEYTGQSPTTTWTNNVEGYTASLTMPALEKNVGSYVVYIPVTFTKGSESFSTEVAYRYTIKSVELTAKVNDASRVYGDNNPAFSITYSGFINGENENVVTTKPTVTTTATASSNVGIYPISISGGVAQNYTLKYETGILTITKAALEVSVNNATKVYGSENPAFTLKYIGLKNNETKPRWEKSPMFSTTADKKSDVGGYQVSVDCSATNYNITKNNSGILTITPATLTIKANNASRLYFDADPEYTYVATGFLNGDTGASFTQTPKFKTNATATSNVGTYTIIPYGAKSKNYNVIYENGNLTITKRTLTAKADAISREYGENNPIFSISYDGFVNNENESTLNVIPSATTSATPTSNVGTYTISLNGGSATNYNLALKSGILTITKAPLAIVINDATRSYGASNPSFGAIYNGLKNDETIPTWSVSPNFKTTATITSSVGSYPIEMISGTPRNYEISGVTNGTLSITPAHLTIKAKDANKTYYEENPSFTYVCTGFVNGDNASSALQVQPTLSTPANLSSNVGTYEIVAKDASSYNYNIVYTPGVLTVNKRQLIAKVGSYERVYGEKNPSFTIEYEGFVGNDNESCLSIKPTAKTSAILTSNVGNYPINISGGDANNYKFSYTSGVLTINKAEQTLLWEQDLSNIAVGSQIELKAYASSGLPIEYTMEKTSCASLYAVGNKTFLDCISAGNVQLRAMQTGNNNYYATPRVVNYLNIVGNTNSDPILTIIQGEGGTVSTQVAKGSIYTFKIESIPGWKVHSATFNDEDITHVLDEKGQFTTSNITSDSKLNVAYEMEDGTYIKNAQKTKIKVQGMSNGLKIVGCAIGEVINVYTSEGLFIASKSADGAEVLLTLPIDKIYIVKIGSLTVKVRI